MDSTWRQKQCSCDTGRCWGRQNKEQGASVFLDITCKERLDRESVLEPTEERSKAANTEPNGALGTPVQGTHRNLKFIGCAFYCTVGTKVFPVWPNEWTSDIFVNIYWNVFCCGCYNKAVLRFVIMMITLVCHCRLLVTECWRREKRVLVK
jgi:hypothetical protein